MAAVTSILILALIAVSAVRSDLCGTIHIGQKTGIGIKLTKTFLQPGTADWEVAIPPVIQCPNEPAGLSAIVCDYDILPTGQFLDKSLIRIHRVGNLQGYGSVTPVVYCGDPWLPPKKPWQSNQHWSSNSQGLSSQPQWTENVQNDQKQWEEPSKLWDHKPQILIAVPQ